MQRTLKIDELINKRKKLSARRIAKLFKGFCLFCFQKAKETENTSADYQVKEIICSMGFKTA